MVISTGNLPATTLFPSLPLASWQDTYTVLHLWTQIVGKIRLALSPNINHWWQSTLPVLAPISIDPCFYLPTSITGGNRLSMSPRVG
jgi:Family of unknown function (DUF5996)